MNSRIHLFVVLGLTGLCSLGCNRAGSSAAKGEVAVVDLDQAAKALGWLDQIESTLQSTETDLRGQVQAAAQAAIQSIAAAKTAVATEANLTAAQRQQLDEAQDIRDLAKLPLTEAQRTKLAQAVNQANGSLQMAQARSQQALQQRRIELITRYRGQVRPVAQSIADAQGFQVVLTAGDGILYHTGAVDITEAVIAKLRESAAAPAPFVAPGQ